MKCDGLNRYWVGKPIKQVSNSPLSFAKMKSFKELKKASSSGALAEKLMKEAEALNSTKDFKDDRIFSVERNKDGLGFAIVRFLPAPAGEEKSTVKMYNHGFKVNGKWLIENCPTTISGECPICASNSVLYNSGIESNKKIVTERKRKLSYYSNVYVVKNPSNPELEGKVMIYRYGQKIHEKIMAARNPQFEGEVAIEPFDLWSEGANFRIKVKTVKESSGRSYPNYDDSSFDVAGPLLDGNDETLENIWKQCYSLAELVAEDKFKPEAELQKQLNRVLGTSSTKEQEQQFDRISQDTNSANLLEELEANSRNSSSDEEDSLLSQFKGLVGDEDEEDEIPF